MVLIFFNECQEYDNIVQLSEQNLPLDRICIVHGGVYTSFGPYHSH